MKNWKQKWKEVSPYTGLPEDAPANNASSGAVSMPPDAVHQKKKKRTLIDRKGSKFVEKVKKEMSFPSSYDIARPIASLNASKKKKK